MPGTRTYPRHGSGHGFSCRTWVLVSNLGAEPSAQSPGTQAQSPGTQGQSPGTPGADTASSRGPQHRTLLLVRPC